MGNDQLFSGAKMPASITNLARPFVPGAGAIAEAAAAPAVKPEAEAAVAEDDLMDLLDVPEPEPKAKPKKRAAARKKPTAE